MSGVHFGPHPRPTGSELLQVGPEHWPYFPGEADEKRRWTTAGGDCISPPGLPSAAFPGAHSHKKKHEIRI